MGLDPNNLPPSFRAKMVGVAPVPAPATFIPHPSTNLVPQKSTDEEKLNKLERSWLAYLRVLYPADNIGVQSCTLKIAADTRYTPDFWVIDANGQLVFYETKGFFRDDAKVKIKVAARLFRHFRFILVERKKGQWIETPIAP